MTDDRGVQAETLDLDGIRARCEAATEGPWVGASQNRRRDGVGIVAAQRSDGDSAPVAVLAGASFTIKDRAANTQFIAHARSDVPALLDLVERLRAKVEAVEAQIGRYETSTIIGLLRIHVIDDLRAALASHDGKDGQKCDTCHGEPEILLNEAQHGGVPAHHGPCPDCSKGDQR